LITGGAGFIGSTVIRHALKHTHLRIINIDALTYAGNLASLELDPKNQNHTFIHANICQQDLIQKAFDTYQPDAIMHLAAESHVDRSISAPLEFLTTNVMGTGILLETSRDYWSNLPPDRKASFRFHHISTDEVFGSLPEKGLFHEESPYQPNSPYSASKAASDHLVRSWHKTYELPIIITNCSNNYGPYQFPEKLIPFTILNALRGNPIPIYGKGEQIRDWLYVEDHARALLDVLHNGIVGETYAIGGRSEKQNIVVAQDICNLLMELAPEKAPSSGHYADLITHVTDRPGHDTRYAINSDKIEETLHWKPQENFKSGLTKTVQWYLQNQQWWDNILSGKYRLARPQTE